MTLNICFTKKIFFWFCFSSLSFVADSAIIPLAFLPIQFHRRVCKPNPVFSKLPSAHASHAPEGNVPQHHLDVVQRRPHHKILLTIIFIKRSILHSTKFPSKNETQTRNTKKSQVNISQGRKENADSLRFPIWQLEFMPLHSTVHETYFRIRAQHCPLADTCEL